MPEVSPLQLAAGITAASRQAGATDPTVRRADWQTAVVTAVGTDGTVDIGSVRARRLKRYNNPTVGDQVMVTQNGAGNWVAVGRLAPAVDDDWTSYTPTVTGGGSATWSLRDGWYKRDGKLTFIGIYIAANGAGSGTSSIVVSLPTVPFRGSSDRRQVVSCYMGGVGAGSNSSISGSFCALILAGGGSAAQIDQLQGPTNIVLRGDNITTSTAITITGCYREA
jgi:hypothetical protein